MIRAVLDDVEARQVQDKPMKLWMTRLKGVVDEAEIALNEFAYEILPLNGIPKVRHLALYSGREVIWTTLSKEKARYLHTLLLHDNMPNNIRTWGASIIEKGVGFPPHSKPHEFRLPSPSSYVLLVLGLKFLIFLFQIISQNIIKKIKVEEGLRLINQNKLPIFRILGDPTVRSS
ncbi:hypothetical protein LguiA_002651 [Lonicera macranthoides]